MFYSILYYKVIEYRSYITLYIEWALFYVLTTSLSLCASIGIILNIGSSSIKTLGGDFLKHLFSRSQHAPSK